MTLDRPDRAGQGAALDRYLMDRLGPAKGAVNCDLIARRLRKRNLAELREVMLEGVDLLGEILGMENKSEPAE